MCHVSAWALLTYMRRNATCLGLTNRLLSILYKTTAHATPESAGAVVIKLDDSVILDLEPDHVYYAWHRMLHVLGSPNLLVMPTIFLNAMTGMYP